MKEQNLLELEVAIEEKQPDPGILDIPCEVRDYKL
jgi:hypothetical protein